MEVCDFAQHIRTTVHDIKYPKSIKGLQRIVQDNYRLSPPLPICLAGGKFSQGGQTFIRDGLYLDLQYLNKMKLLKANQNTDKYQIGQPLLRVQAGASWHQVQCHLDRYDWAVAEMQSYNNFSVGGSISVNCHGRGVIFGTIADTIIEMDVMLSNGRILTTFPRDDLFRAVVGGYGGVAIILSAILLVVPNVIIRRKVISTEGYNLADIPHLLSDPQVLMYNGTVYPQANSSEPEIVHVLWQKVEESSSSPITTENPTIDSITDYSPIYQLNPDSTESDLTSTSSVDTPIPTSTPTSTLTSTLISTSESNPRSSCRSIPLSAQTEKRYKLTITDRLHSNHDRYWYKMMLEQLVRRFNWAKSIRAQVESQELSQKCVVWLNYEMSHDAQQLEPLIRFPTTTILQEYFLPLAQGSEFHREFWSIIQNYAVNILNLSIRYVKATTIPILNYVPLDCYSFVLYLNIRNTRCGFEYSQTWTRKVIDLGLRLGGRYYLPYLPWASQKQFQAAYPHHNLYLKIKQKYDPDRIFQNLFLTQYVIS